jgi:hypothetical protein
VELKNEGGSGQVGRDEQRTYGIAEWAATLRARRTEKELAALAAVTREFPFPRAQCREVRVRRTSGATARA